MTKAIEAGLSDLREMVSEQWFLDNPNSEVNEEITALIDALELAVKQLESITSTDITDSMSVEEHLLWLTRWRNGVKQDCAYILKQIEQRLGGG